MENRLMKLKTFAVLGVAAAMGLAPRTVPALLLAALGGYALPAQAEMVKAVDFVKSLPISAEDRQAMD